LGYDIFFSGHSQNEQIVSQFLSSSVARCNWCLRCTKPEKRRTQSDAGGTADCCF
jgi:hypothetical protein